MKPALRILLVISVLAALLALVSPVSADNPTIVVVGYGDTLYSIAARYGTTVDALMRANSLPDPKFIWVGQRLIVPQVGETSSSAASSVYTVAPGDTIYSIAARFGVTVDALARANGLYNTDLIFTGQRLMIPGRAAQATPQTATAAAGPSKTPSALATPQPGTVMTSTLKTPAAPATLQPGTVVTNTLKTPGAPATLQPGTVVTGVVRPVPTPQPTTVVTTTVKKASVQPRTAVTGTVTTAPAPTIGKWIDVNLTAQTTTALEGDTVIKAVLASTGTAVHKTPVGSFAIRSKVASQTMSGGYGADYYYLPGVPWVMYFFEENALHGAYWHTNFGHPMSHGCVNLAVEDAKWLYDWAEIGTPVIVHV